MESFSGRSDYESAQISKERGKEYVPKKGVPPGFPKSSKISTVETKLDQFKVLGSSNHPSDGPFPAPSGGSSGSYNRAFSDVGSTLSSNHTNLISLKDNFDSFLDDSLKDNFDSFLDGAAPETTPSNVFGQPSGGQPVAPISARIGGLFLPYLPQDDAVAAGLGAREGGVDATEAQEVVDHLNEQLGSLLRCSPPEFWKKVAMDESLDTFIDSYLHFRRRWYDGITSPDSSSHTAGVIVGDGNLSRRVFMLLYRMSSNQDPGVPASKSLSAKEHAALLKEWKLLDLPKLLDICAVYDHDNHELTSRLVSNVFRVQPSLAADLTAMVRPLLGMIDTMHQRCCAIINSLQESEVEGVKEQLTEVVEYLNDVVITLDSFVSAYPPAASILITAGDARDGIGMFLPALGAIYDFMLPAMSTGFTALGNPSTSLYEKEATELAAQARVKQLKSRIVDFAWKILQACFLGKKENKITLLRDIPSLGVNVDQSNLLMGVNVGQVNVDPIKAVEDPAVKGDLLVQAAVAMTMGLGDEDVEKTLVSLGAKHTSNRGVLLQRVEKRHGLCETIHELCQSGFILMDDAQYEYFLSLLSRGDTVKVSNPYNLGTEDKGQNEEAIMLQSKISQVKDLFPDYGDGFVALCLEAYDNDPEKVISCILEGRLHPDLASLDVSMVTKPSKETEAPRDKGKGKVSEELRALDKEKMVVSFDAGKTSSRLSSLSPIERTATGGSEGSSSGRQAPASAPIENIAVLPNVTSNQGRFTRRGKEGGTFSELMNMREKDRAFNATVRAGKQYEYEDEYDDSFDDLTSTYLADAGEEETENAVDRAKRQSVPRSVKDEGSDWRPSSKPSSQRGGLHQMVSGRAEQGSVWRHDELPKESGTGLLPNPSRSNITQPSSSGRGGPSSVRGGHHSASSNATQPSGIGRGGPSSVRGGHHSAGQSAQKWKDHEGRKYAPVTPETTSSSRIGTLSNGATEENVPMASGGSLDQGRPSTPQGSTGAARGGKSRRGKGKVEPTSNFYLKDGKLYSYKVAGAEAGFASVEEYEASHRVEEETMFGLGAGGNVPAANVEERDSSGNLAQAPGGRGTGGRGRGGPAGRGRYPSKSYDNHRRKDQSMKKHFAGLGGL